ncbi:MAG: glycosyltransferase family 4 protein [Pseudomonadota bacterium]
MPDAGDLAGETAAGPDGIERTAGDPPLAVIVKGYPRLSETFIAQELEALEQRGFRFDIWSLRAPYDAFEHPVHGRIAAARRYLPEYLHREPLRVLGALWRVRRLAGFGAAFRAFMGDLGRDLTRNRVRRFGQAAVLAAELPAATRFLYVHFLHTPGSVTRYAALMRGLEWGVSAHAKDIWTTPAREIADKLGEARFAVTCTKAGVAELTRHAGDPGRVHLAYHGLAKAEMPSPPARPRRDDSRPVSLISVGRLVEKKGYDDLIAALARLPATLDWRLVHIGGGALSSEMQARARDAGIDGRIDWRGKQPRDAVVAALAQAEIFVLPSKVAGDGDRDGLPNVIMEAASQALAIVATEAAAIPEFVRDGVEGLLVPPGDPAALAAAVARLADDPALCAQLGGAALQRLDAHFRPEPGMVTIETLLRGGLGDAAPPTAKARDSLGTPA